MTVVTTLAIRGGDTGDVLIEADRIVASASEPTAATLDATGCRVFPGFVDLQCNGGFGVDFTTSPERAHEVAARLPETGVTSFLPTVITAPPEVTLRAITELDSLRTSSPEQARSLGVHLEGPFINPSRGGAHPRQHIRPPDRAEAARWLAAGVVAMVTLAPELDGALDLIADLAATRRRRQLRPLRDERGPAARRNRRRSHCSDASLQRDGIDERPLAGLGRGGARRPRP